MFRAIELKYFITGKGLERSSSAMISRIVATITGMRSQNFIFDDYDIGCYRLFVNEDIDQLYELLNKLNLQAAKTAKRTGILLRTSRR